MFAPFPFLKIIGHSPSVDLIVNMPLEGYSSYNGVGGVQPGMGGGGSGSGEGVTGLT